MSWSERPQGTPEAYEAAQARVLALMQHWEPPETVTIHQFLVRVGEYGGYAVIETDDPAAVHRMCSSFAVFAFCLEPVIDIGDAVAAEAEALEWRDGLG